jgi:hypothetical protein
MSYVEDVSIAEAWRNTSLLESLEMPHEWSKPGGYMRKQDSSACRRGVACRWNEYQYAELLECGTQHCIAHGITPIEREAAKEAVHQARLESIRARTFLLLFLAWPLLLYLLPRVFRTALLPFGRWLLHGRRAT